MHKTCETVPPIINPLQVAGVESSAGADVTVSSCCTGCIRSMYGGGGVLEQVRISISVRSEERFCQNEDRDGPDSQPR